MKTDTDNTTGSDCLAATGSAFTNEQAHCIANQLKRWLEDGGTVKATDPANVLTPLSDGTLHGGMTITGQNAERRNAIQ